MTEHDQILLDAFKSKLRLLIHKCDNLKDERRQLREQLEILRKETVALKEDNDRLAKRYDDLKTARVIAASDSDSKQVKQRITKIVREIDKCIARLNV